MLLRLRRYSFAAVILACLPISAKSEDPCIGWDGASACGSPATQNSFLEMLIPGFRKPSESDVAQFFAAYYGPSHYFLERATDGSRVLSTEGKMRYGRNFLRDGTGYWDKEFNTWKSAKNDGYVEAPHQFLNWLVDTHLRSEGYVRHNSKNVFFMHYIAPWLVDDDTVKEYVAQLRATKESIRMPRVAMDEIPAYILKNFLTEAQIRNLHWLPQDSELFLFENEDVFFSWGYGQNDARQVYYYQLLPDGKLFKAESQLEFGGRYSLIMNNSRAVIVNGNQFGFPAGFFNKPACPISRDQWLTETGECIAGLKRK